jgi:hypothetical protein
MSRALRTTACAIAAATVAAGVAGIVVAVLAASEGAKQSTPAAGLAAFVVAGLVPSGGGLFVALRRPGNRVAWILLAGPLSVALVMAAGAVAGLALHRDPDSSLGAWATVIAGEWPVLFLWPLALAFVFPDGRLPSRRWRAPAAFACAAAGGIVALIFLAPEQDGPYGTIDSPVPFAIPKHVLLPLFWSCWVGLLASLFVGAAAMRARYRAGGAQQRRQVLWLAYGALVVPLWLLGGSLWSAFIGSFDPIDGIGLVFFQVWPGVAVAVAVTRHGLYAIDRLLNRTLVCWPTSRAAPRCPSTSSPPPIARRPRSRPAAYFVACEALTNAVKHASPTRVAVHTAREDGVLRLLVSDDGVGGAHATSGSGLPGMADRVAAHGGTLAIESPAGAGTRVAVELPCGS